MKVVVTGGNGFVGSHLVDALVERDYEVHVVDDLSAQCNEKFYFNEKARNLKINILDYEELLKAFDGAMVVFHLAAHTRIPTSILNPLHAIKVNVEGTGNVLQAARNTKVDRVIYSSTSACYGLKNAVPFKEDMQRDCLNPYAVTKLAAEDLCIMYSQLFGLKTISLRYFNIYGERSPTGGTYAPVIGLFLRQFKYGDKVTIVGDGCQRRDFIHVHDVVMANIAAAFTSNDNAFGDTYNVGTGKDFSILEIADAISGNNSKIYEFLSDRPGEARNTLANINKIKNIIGWEPKINFLDWLETQIKPTLQSRLDQECRIGDESYGNKGISHGNARYHQVHQNPAFDPN